MTDHPFAKGITGGFGWWFDTANTSFQKYCVKNAFKIAKRQSLTEKIQVNFIMSTILKSRKIDIK